MRTKISKLRSPLWRTAVLAITSVLLVTSGGCGHDSPDTDITPSTDKGGTSVCISTSTAETTTTSSMAVTTLQTTSVTATEETTTTVMTTMTSTPEMATSPITQTETERDFECEEQITSIPVSEAERMALVNCVAHEYGSDWVSVYDKACVVATVMNRVYSSQFPDTVLEVLSQPGQFADSESYSYLGMYSYQVTNSCVEAVDYYFSHSDEFGSYLYFEGNGTVNIFY